MTDNEALRSMVAELRLQNDNLLGRYASIIGSKDIEVPKLGPMTVGLTGFSSGLATIAGGIWTRNATVVGVGYEANVIHNGEWVYGSPLVVANPPSPDPASYYHLWKLSDGVYIMKAVTGGYAIGGPVGNYWRSDTGIGGTYVPHGLFTNTGTYGVPVVTPGDDEALLVIRASNLLAIKTLVTNQGAGAMEVYEEGFLVAILQQYETWVSPLTGRGEISVAGLGDGTTCAIATYLSA